ncbi:HAD family hydrolase [Streptomyces sp. NPDC002845]
MTATGHTSGGAEDPHPLPGLLSTAQAVLFDFDGPICDLFGTTSTSGIARKVKKMARQQWNTLDPAVEQCDDSHDILRLLSDMVDRSEPSSLDRTPLTTANDIITDFEYVAVNSAEPAQHIHTLLDALLDLDKRLGVVTNNAEGPVRRFLELRELDSKFETVCGRDPHEPRLMKPDPGLVLRALKNLGGMEPAGALMVGDQLTDLSAARSAGVRFLGCTSDDGRAEEMRREGADHVVGSHAPVVRACGLLSVGCSPP